METIGYRIYLTDWDGALLRKLWPFSVWLHMGARSGPTVAIGAGKVSLVGQASSG